MNERGRFSVPMAFATAGGGGGGLNERGRVRQGGNLPEKVENHWSIQYTPLAEKTLCDVYRHLQ